MYFYICQKNIYILFCFFSSSNVLLSILYFLFIIIFSYSPFSFLIKANKFIFFSFYLTTIIELISVSINLLVIFIL